MNPNILYLSPMTLKVAIVGAERKRVECCQKLNERKTCIWSWKIWQSFTCSIMETDSVSNEQEDLTKEISRQLSQVSPSSFKLLIIRHRQRQAQERIATY